MTPVQVPVAELFPWEPGIFSLAIYTFMVFALIGIFLFLTRWLGERRETPGKRTPYECGIFPTGSARFRYPVPFYLVAIFFLIFDVEAVFLLPFAVSFGGLPVGASIGMLIFLLLLVEGLAWAWQKGVLSWK